MITYGRQTDPPAGEIDCYEGVELKFGNFCSIGSGLKILSGTHPCVEYPEVVSQYPFHEQWFIDYPPSTFDGKVTIGNDVWISTDVSILSGVTIGDGAIIGAKSVVTKDVAPYTFVAGNPAILKKWRFKKDQIAQLLLIQWWDWDDSKIRESMPYMKNINDFLLHNRLLL